MPPKRNLAKDKGVFGQQMIDANAEAAPVIRVVEDVSDHSQTESQGSSAPHTGEKTITTANMNQHAVKEYASAMRLSIDSALHDWLQANVQPTFTVIKPFTDLMQKMGDQITKSIDRQMEYMTEKLGADFFF